MICQNIPSDDHCSTSISGVKSILAPLYINVRKLQLPPLRTDEAGEVHLEVSDKVLLAELQDGGVAGERQEAPLPVGVRVARHVGRVQGHHVHRVVVVVLLIFCFWRWKGNILQDETAIIFANRSVDELLKFS